MERVDHSHEISSLFQHGLRLIVARYTRIIMHSRPRWNVICCYSFSFCNVICRLLFLPATTKLCCWVHPFDCKITQSIISGFCWNLWRGWTWPKEERFRFRWQAGFFCGFWCRRGTARIFFAVRSKLRVRWARQVAGSPFSAEGWELRSLLIAAIMSQPSTCLAMRAYSCSVCIFICLFCFLPICCQCPLRRVSHFLFLRESRFYGSRVLAKVWGAHARSLREFYL